MFDPKTTAALKKMLLVTADDHLILGHRNSEWTGLGPILEEDIAFSSIAQDKIGHALGLYSILHEHLGEADPDTLAFMRNEKEFFSAQLVEFPIGEYDFSLMRHFLFDHAAQIRFDHWALSSYEPLARLARKVKGEIKYHVFHANTWVKQLAEGNEESKARMQTALNEVYPLALGLFEVLEDEHLLIENGIHKGEAALQQLWTSEIEQLLGNFGLKVPTQSEAIFGGRKGYHTEHLQPLLNEMTEVFRVDPSAEW
jgi:ring-1,2-phenylacetyl-CoA epoxidase subunit PaaC